MKTWAYFSGGIFLVLLIGLSISKLKHWRFSDALFYLFIASAAVFFFTFIFAAFKRPGKK